MSLRLPATAGRKVQVDTSLAIVTDKDADGLEIIRHSTDRKSVV